MARHGNETTCGVDGERRSLLQCLAAAGLVALGCAAGLPAAAADAEGWPKEAFRQKTEKNALQKLFGKAATASDKLSLDLPEIAENGKVVPVSVRADIEGVTALAILVPGNPGTLAAYYAIPPGTEPALSCRLKMQQTSDVVLVAEAGGKLYRAAKPVKVTVSGCGG